MMAQTLTNEAINWLTRLVAIDTSNPPRNPANNAQALGVLCGALAGCGFAFEDFDWGDGCLGLLAVRGRGQLLFNVHLDTVPAGDRWTAHPWTLTTRDDRLVGLGACDIKGAAACLVAAARRTSGDVALLFTTDEEAGHSRCVPGAIEQPLASDKTLGSRGVIVCEPTSCAAVTAHRGLATSTGRFTGAGGHSSESRALHDSAIHALVRWGAAALEYAQACQTNHDALMPGICFNMGRIEGGIKNNMIATDAIVRFGIRPGPGLSCDKALSAIEALAGDDRRRVNWQRGFEAPPLPDGHDTAQRLSAARLLAQQLELPPGDPVDFWTEGSLFSRAGYTTIVFGPGSIVDAHRPDESVAIDQVATAVDAFARLLSS